MKQKILVLSLFLLLSACSSQLPLSYSEKTLNEKSYVENKGKKYIVHADSSYKIEILNASELDFKNSKKATFIAKNKASRPIFKLQGKDTIRISNRRLDFKNTANFRDIGGLPTPEGKTIKWGKIFRSDNFSKLRAKDFKKFEALQISQIIDLRTSSEIEGKQDHLPKSINYEAIPIVDDHGDLLAQMKGKVIRGEVSVSESKALMRELYENGVTKNIPALREVILKIVNAEEPVLYHCSAGKDRTGIITALLLSVLKVDRETIVNEYLLSNYYRREKIANMLQKIKIAKIIKPKLAPQVVLNFMNVDEEYINATFSAIEKNYGTMDNFIQNALQIDEALQNKFIAKMTY